MIDIGDRDVKRMQVGESPIYDKPEWSKTWVEIPDTGVEGVDFTGMEIMNFNPETGVATFKGLRLVSIGGRDNVVRWRKLLELPEGYKFVNNPDTLGLISTGDGDLISYPAKYESGTLSVQLGHNFSSDNQIVFILNRAKYGGIQGAGEIRFNVNVQFNVEKEW